MQLFARHILCFDNIHEIFFWIEELLIHLENGKETRTCRIFWDI